MSNENWKAAFRLGYAGALINSNNNQHLKSKHSISLLINALYRILSRLCQPSAGKRHRLTKSSPPRRKPPLSHR